MIKVGDKVRVAEDLYGGCDEDYVGKEGVVVYGHSRQGEFVFPEAEETLLVLLDDSELQTSSTVEDEGKGITYTDIFLPDELEVIASE